VTVETVQIGPPVGSVTAGAHVAVSELMIAVEGTASLEDAFRNRLGEVDTFPGHLGLQVWKDDRRPGRYLMVTWWTTEAAFHAYLRSDSHRRSHARIPSDPARPHAVRVDRYSLLSS
jgi:heme-degrading monooxygenase HmoA